MSHLPLERLFLRYRGIRSYLLHVTHDMTFDELCNVPTGAANNVLWNLGHVLTDECNMLYTPAGAPSPLPASFHSAFDPGSSPSQWSTPPEPDEIRKRLSERCEHLQRDHQEGRFEQYKPVTMDDGITLNNFQDALAHCLMHEAMHIGVCITLKRIVTGRSSTH